MRMLLFWVFVLGCTTVEQVTVMGDTGTDPSFGWVGESPDGGSDGRPRSPRGDAGFPEGPDTLVSKLDTAAYPEPDGTQGVPEARQDAGSGDVLPDHSDSGEPDVASGADTPPVSPDTETPAPDVLPQTPDTDSEPVCPIIECTPVTGIGGIGQTGIVQDSGYRMFRMSCGRVGLLGVSTTEKSSTVRYQAMTETGCILGAPKILDEFSATLYTGWGSGPPRAVLPSGNFVLLTDTLREYTPEGDFVGQYGNYEALNPLEDTSPAWLGLKGEAVLLMPKDSFPFSSNVYFHLGVPDPGFATGSLFGSYVTFMGEIVQTVSGIPEGFYPGDVVPTATGLAKVKGLEDCSSWQDQGVCVNIPNATLSLSYTEIRVDGTVWTSGTYTHTMLGKKQGATPVHAVALNDGTFAITDVRNYALWNPDPYQIFYTYNDTMGELTYVITVTTPGITANWKASLGVGKSGFLFLYKESGSPVNDLLLFRAGDRCTKDADCPSGVCSTHGCVE